MLDKSKLPRNVAARLVWLPDGSDGSGRPVAYVTDLGRSRAGAALILLGVVLAGLVLVGGAALWLAFGGLLIAMAGALHGSGGRTGFYEIRPDGGLGGFLGRTRPPPPKTHQK